MVCLRRIESVFDAIHFGKNEGAVLALDVVELDGDVHHPPRLVIPDILVAHNGRIAGEATKMGTGDGLFVQFLCSKRMFVCAQMW